jgi:hypothetical protein
MEQTFPANNFTNINFEKDLERGFIIEYVKAENGSAFTIITNHTMMRINLATPPKPGTLRHLRLNGFTISITTKLKVMSGWANYLEKETGLHFAQFYPIDGSPQMRCGRMAEYTLGKWGIWYCL